ncbi:MAG: C25 family cysteine peptidase [candidate division WOR-3 bacterium]
MKRSLAVLIAVCLPLVAGTMTQTVRFDRSDLIISKDNNYDAVNITGFPALSPPGEPLLPLVVQSLVIPSGAIATGVELLTVEWVELPGTYNIGPAQPDVILPRPGHDEKPRLVGPDHSVYSSAEPYPAQTLRLLASGTMAGYRIANVELRPVQYSPATGRVWLATKLTFRLTYAEGERAAVATERQRNRFGQVVKRLVANPEDVTRFAPAVRRSTTSVLPPGDYDYVVVTEAPMDTVFQRLADWKTLKGVPGKVVLISWINANYTGYDLQEKIRNFIKDAYATWGTQYVLLGGSGDYANTGQNIFPTRMAQYEGNGAEPCDLYWAGLDGNWDANGNHTYGEIPDNADMYSDVYVGRASVYTVAMAQNFVNKTIKYEQSPPTGFIKRMLLPTAILWSSYEERPMVESIARQASSRAFQIGRLYERNGTLSQAAVCESLNRGWGMSHWDGHGSPTGIYMGSTPYFSSTNAQAMTNGDKTGVAVAIACDCAAWDQVSGGDCLAEHMVNRVGGGFIATVMNTRYGYGAIGPGGNYVPGPSERLDTTLYAGVFYYGMPATGQALAYSKATWAPYADSLYQYAHQRFCIYDLTLIGDPETPLWTAEPTPVNVAHSGVITIGNNVPYPVTVTTGFAPVCSALVCLKKPGEVDVKGRTNSSGQVTLFVSALTPGPMTMTVSARDHFPFLDTVQVIASNRYVSHLRSWVLDPAPGGNNDSILNPGETVNIPTWVKNWGQQTAMSVTAKFRTADPNAQVTDSARSFGNIGAGDSAFTGVPGFGLHVNSGLPNAYSVACSLICRDANDSVWVSLLSYQVGTPVLEKRTQTVVDTAHGGNGNGRLDPNETVDLAVWIANTGLGHGYNCRGVLKSGDSRLIVLDSTASYGRVRKGDSATNAGDWYTVRAQAGIPPETPLVCTLRLYADGGYSVVRTFNIIVGEFRNIDPIPDGPRLPALYWAYDDKDTGYTHHPQYQWVEIRSQGTQLNFSHNDAVITVNLPTGFGPVKYYGQRFTQLSISADGWIVPGNYTTTNYTNTGLPSTAAPPRAICANWDDLYPGYSSQDYAYYYHDAANHRFVVEFDSVKYYDNSIRDKFEFIFYDTTLAAGDGNSRILVQYRTANGYTSSTIGLQDGTQQVGIQCLYDGSYHKGCAAIAAGRAVLYTTDPPSQVGLSSEPWTALVDVRGLALWPNPCLGRATVSWNVPIAGRVELAVYDASGREVSQIVSDELAAGRHTRTWDGRALAPGVYFVKLDAPGSTRRQKLILTR